MLLSSPTVQDLERLTARVFESSTRTAGARLEAYREDGTFFVDIDLPGADPVSIDITADGQMLTVRAERGAERTSDLIAERQVQLSDRLDTDRLEARYDRGVLTLSIPVLQPGRPGKAEVTGAG